MERVIRKVANLVSVQEQILKLCQGFEWSTRHLGYKIQPQVPALYFILKSIFGKVGQKIFCVRVLKLTAKNYMIRQKYKSEVSGPEMILPNLYQHNIQDSSQHFIYNVFLLLTIGPTLYNWPVLEEVLTCCFSASCKIETKHRNWSESQQLKGITHRVCSLGATEQRSPGRVARFRRSKWISSRLGDPVRLGKELVTRGLPSILETGFQNKNKILKTSTTFQKNVQCNDLNNNDNVLLTEVYSALEDLQRHQGDNIVLGFLSVLFVSKT